KILFSMTYFGPQLVNSALLAACVVLITLLTALPAGYVLARLRLPAGEILGIAIFATYLVPAIVLFLPLARVVGMLGLFDSWWALVLVYPTFTIPFCTWLMVGFFRAVPRELEEAAWIDGCGLVRGLVHVVIPQSLPGIATVAVFAFTLSMQEYLYALALAS